MPTKKAPPTPHNTNITTPFGWQQEEIKICEQHSRLSLINSPTRTTSYPSAHSAVAMNHHTPLNKHFVAAFKNYSAVKHILYAKTTLLAQSHDNFLPMWRFGTPAGKPILENLSFNIKKDEWTRRFHS
jgi:hypothetical protein